MSAPMLSIEALVAGYEPGAPIVNGVSLSASAGELVVILGPNGAGKSTLIKAVAGLVPISGGHVRLEGAELTGAPAHEMTRRGLAYVPQTENVFATLSIADNLALAAQQWPAPQRGPRIARALELFPDLAPKRTHLAGRLSGGQRQMLAVARALIVEPRLLLLDEPSAGLSPKVVGELFAQLRHIADAGVGILLVEQNVRAALGIADRVYVLVDGRNRLEGSAAALAGDPAIAALYLGGKRTTTATAVAS